MADPHKLLQSLAEQMTMMSDADQQFLLGCQTTVSVAGAPLSAEQVKRLHALAAAMQQTEHSVMGLGAPLSMPKVLKDLSSAVHMLSPAEHAFALKCSRILASGRTLDLGDIEKLLNIHSNKGF